MFLLAIPSFSLQQTICNLQNVYDFMVSQKTWPCKRFLVNFTYFLHILHGFFAHFCPSPNFIDYFFTFFRHFIQFLRFCFYVIFHIFSEYAAEKMRGCIAGNGKPHYEKFREKVSNYGKNSVNYQYGNRHIQIPHCHNKRMDHCLF